MKSSLLIIFAAVTVRSQITQYPPTSNGWQRVPVNPVLNATEPWEGIAANNPCVCENVASFNGTHYVMFYRGGWGTQGVGLATSLDGITWTKYANNPVYGYPYDGGQPWIFHDPNDSGTLYLYTTNNQVPRTNIALSTNGGYNWTTQANTSVPLPQGATLYGNRVVWQETVNTNIVWYMLQELMYNGPWQIFLYTSSNGLQWTLLNNELPLTTLQLHPNGMYGGPRFSQINGQLTPKWSSDGLYHLWYHATNSSGSLPTDIYHAQSSDLLTWTISPGPALQHTGGNSFEHDQVAGPVVLSVNNLAYLYYDGDNNVVGECAIGLAMANSTSNN